MHPSTNLDEYNQTYIAEPTSHAGLLYNDVQASSPMLEYPTESDSVGSELFTGIGNDIDDWGISFIPSTKSQFSTEEYWALFNDSQPYPLGTLHNGR